MAACPYISAAISAPCIADAKLRASASLRAESRRFSRSEKDFAFFAVRIIFSTRLAPANTSLVATNNTLTLERKQDTVCGTVSSVHPLGDITCAERVDRSTQDANNADRHNNRLVKVLILILHFSFSILLGVVALEKLQIPPCAGIWATPLSSRSVMSQPKNSAMRTDCERLGSPRPCSQLWTVPCLTPNTAPGSDCDTPNALLYFFICLI